MRVLHLGLEKSWRGGENQILLLIQGLLDPQYNVENFVAYPKNSRGLTKFSKIVPTLSLPSSKSYDLRSMWALYHFCSENKIQLIDAHSSGAHGLALMVRKLMPQIKVVVHRRVDNPISKRWSTKNKYTSPLVDQFVCISTAIKLILVQYGVPESKVRTVKSAVDFSKYQILNKNSLAKALRSKYRISEKTVLLGNASAFCSQKGYDVLIQSLKPLKNKGLDFHCFLAGDGELKAEMESLVRNLNLSDKVTFLGFIDNVPEFLSSINILTMPSNNEGLGTLILDATGAGCAVVATRVGGIPEMIIHGETGLTVEKGDSKALSHEIEKLIEAPLLIQKYNRSALEFVEKEFSIRNMVQGNYQVYSEVLSQECN